MRKTPAQIQRLTVLFDEECSLCARLKYRLQSETLWIELEFLAYQHPSTGERFPGVEAFEPQKHLVVVDDNQQIYCAESAWIMVLYATRAYRDLSVKLAAPGFRHLARVACTWISQNRRALNETLFLKHSKGGSPHDHVDLHA